MHTYTVSLDVWILITQRLSYVHAFALICSCKELYAAWPVFASSLHWVVDSPERLCIAVRSGAQNITYPRHYDKVHIGDVVSGRGWLDVVIWLSGRPSVLFSKDAIDLAAMNGHLAVVRFLHESHVAGCSTRGVRLAARAGHLDVLEYLYVNQLVEYSTALLEDAVEGGHMNCIEWVYQKLLFQADYDFHDNIKINTYSVVINNRVDILKWIHATFPNFNFNLQFRADWYLNAALIHGYFEMMQWLHTVLGGRFEDNAMIRAVGDSRYDIVEYLLKHGQFDTRAWRQVSFCEALRSDIDEWLLLNRDHLLV
jgi:hypothetical protein